MLKTPWTTSLWPADCLQINCAISPSVKHLSAKEPESEWVIPWPTLVPSFSKVLLEKVAGTLEELDLMCVGWWTPTSQPFCLPWATAVSSESSACVETSSLWWSWRVSCVLTHGLPALSLEIYLAPQENYSSQIFLTRRNIVNKLSFGRFLQILGCPRKVGLAQPLSSPYGEDMWSSWSLATCAVMPCLGSCFYQKDSVWGTYMFELFWCARL